MPMYPSWKREFLKIFNSYIEKYILDSWKDYFSLDFYHARLTPGAKLGVDLSEYTNIVSQYRKPNRLFSWKWSYVYYLDVEQFLHEYSSWYYTNKSFKLVDRDKDLKKIIVPSIFVKKERQDTVYYI